MPFPSPPRKSLWWGPWQKKSPGCLIQTHLPCMLLPCHIFQGSFPSIFPLSPSRMLGVFHALCFLIPCSYIFSSPSCHYACSPHVQTTLLYALIPPHVIRKLHLIDKQREKDRKIILHLEHFTVQISLRK